MYRLGGCDNAAVPAPTAGNGLKTAFQSGLRLILSVQSPDWTWFSPLNETCKYEQCAPSVGGLNR
jgi:hypothetical protein